MISTRLWRQNLEFEAMFNEAQAGSFPSAPPSPLAGESGPAAAAVPASGSADLDVGLGVGGAVPPGRRRPSRDYGDAAGKEARTLVCIGGGGAEWETYDGADRSGSRSLGVREWARPRLATRLEKDFRFGWQKAAISTGKWASLRRQKLHFDRHSEG